MADEIWKVTVRTMPRGYKVQSLYYPGCQLLFGFDKDQRTVHVSKATPEEVQRPTCRPDWEKCKDLPPNVIEDLKQDEERSRPVIEKLGILDQEQRRAIEEQATHLLTIQVQHSTAMEEFFATFIKDTV